MQRTFYHTVYHTVVVVACGLQCAGCSFGQAPKLRVDDIEPRTAALGTRVDVTLVGYFPVRVSVDFSKRVGLQVAAGYSASLAGHQLLDVTYVDPHTITAVAPASLPAGVHTLTVVAPDHQTRTIEGAFVVSTWADGGGETDGGGDPTASDGGDSLAGDQGSCTTPCICPNGESCSYTCDSCDLSCEGGSICDLSCTSDCNNECQGDAICDLTCGSDCTLGCIGTSTCSLSCTQQCAITGCEGTANCLLSCTDPTNCSLDCRGGSPVDCGGGVLACNRPCP